MSTYAVIEGELFFESEAKHKQAISILTKNGYVVDERWVNEIGQFTEVFEASNLKINIPRNHYRNLIHLLGELVELCKSWDIVSACNDGVFEGMIINTDGFETIDLHLWAKSNGLAMPKKSGNKEVDEEAEAQWENSVLDAFVDEP
jgi:hypothetical protein